MADGVDSVAPLQMRLAIYRRTIEFLEEQRAQFGAFTPPYIRHQLEETRNEIARLKQELQALGVVVEDLPGDFNPPSATPPLVPALDHHELLLAYQRMLVDQLRYLPLGGISDWRDPGLQLPDVYIERTLTPVAQGAVNIALVEAVATPRARIIIEGGPGAGKSASLHWLALTCVASAIGEPASMLDRNVWPDSAPTPIIFTARDLLQSAAGDTNDQRTTALSAFGTAIERQLQLNDLDTLAPTIQQQLHTGGCLVMIDGLDDLPEIETQRVLANAVSRFVARYSNNRYVLTCRQRGAAMTALASFTPYTFAPLEEAQIDSMVARWITAIAQTNGSPTSDELAAHIATLQGHLRADSRLQALVTTPLALALCMLLYSDGRRLPSARGIYAARLLDVLLDRWEQLRTGGLAPSLDTLLGVKTLAEQEQRLMLLQPLALAFQQHMHNGESASATMHIAEIEALLRPSISELGVESTRAIEHVIPRLLAHCCRQGILASSDTAQMYSMPIQPIRERLAAGALARQRDFPTRSYALARDSRWHETLLLAVQELGQGSAPHDARELLRLLLESPRSGLNDLLFAGDCLVELCATTGAEQLLRGEILRRLHSVLGADTLSPAEQVRAGMLLGKLGDSRFDGLLPSLAQIGGGRFLLGTREGYDDEGPEQWVNVPSFAIGVYAVTNGEYARFLEDEPAHPRPRYWYDPRYNNPSQPVVGLTWRDANAYCRWLTERLWQAGQLPRGAVVRLPHEIEWEKAASWDPTQSVKRRFPWGNEWSSACANTVEGRGSWTTAPVGCYPRGVSAYGCHDMVGNVWEWTAMPYESYPHAIAPFREEGSYTLRGSSCASLPIHARCTYRSRLPANYWRYHLGFRVVIGQPL
jgi:formylglycine-generating enzyme required for sulfatase activity